MNMNQEIKKDAGKPRLSLVPFQIIRDIARVREFGLKKYKEKESWKSVEPERYRDALLRHTLLYIEDPFGLDDESGLPHLWHLACNVAFLCELQKDQYKDNKVNLSQIKSLQLSEDGAQKVKETCENMLKDGQGLTIKAGTSPLQYIDNDGFDWSKGDYKEN